jgi:general secretion pathway protein D
MTQPLRLFAFGVLLAALAGCSAASKAGRSEKDTAPPATQVRVETPPEPAPTPLAPTPPAPVVQAPVAPTPPAPPIPSREAAPTPAPVPRSLFTPPSPLAQATPPTPAPPRRFVAFNFDNADVEVVVQAASEIAGFSYVIAPGARGRKVTVQTQGRIASDEIFGVLLTILDVNGLAAVKTGTLYRIIPREGAVQTPVRTIVGREIDEGLPADQVTTQIVPLQYVNSVDMTALLRPFVPAQGAVSAHRETNLLIITDTVANIRRLLEIVKLTDVQVALEDVQIIPLKHADAQEMAQLLGQLFAGGRLRAAVPGAPVVAPALPPGAPPRPPTAAADPGASGERPPLIVAERRSNSLVIHARKQEMETIRRLIDQLDVDLYGGQRVFIYFAENTKARDLAATLDAIYGRGSGPAVTGTQSTAPRVGTTDRPGGPPPSTPPPPTPTPTTPRTPTTPGAPGRAGAPLGEEGVTASEIRFIADEVTNAIIVVTFPRSWKEIEETIKKLDRMPRQVLIEVLAAEVTLDDRTSLGVAWAIRSGRFDVSSAPTGLIPGRPPQSLIPFGASVLSGLNFFTFATDQFLSALNALASDNKVNVLSSPSIMTAENKKAVINVSTSVPILTAQQVPIGGTTTGVTTGIVGTQSVEYRDAGIILTVTPRIGEHGTVALDVKQEVNEVGDPVPPTNSPAFTKREAETSVVLLNNQTLVLGGLIQNRRTVVNSGIPILNKIPVLRYLFGVTQERIQKTELLLLITPRTVGTAVEAARITEEMRRITPEIQESVRRSPRPPLP